MFDEREIEEKNNEGFFSFCNLGFCFLSCFSGFVPVRCIWALLLVYTIPNRH